MNVFEIDSKNIEVFENKIIGCAAIILTGLAYQNNRIYLDNGLSFLRKIVKTSIDNNGFPKSRNIKQLIYYLKYFILIREWFKESQNTIPEFIDETIYYLGQGYSFIWQNVNTDSFFNGNSNSNNQESAHYYINAILDAEIGKNIAVNNQLATANLMAFEILKDSYKNDPRIFPDSQIIERYEDTSIIMDFDYEMMIDEMWENILDS